MVSQKTSRYKNPLAFMKDTKWCKCPSVNRHILFQRSDSWGQRGSKQGRQPLLTKGVEETGECGGSVLLWSLEGWARRPWVSRGVTGLWPWLLLIPVLTGHSSRWTWRGKCISWYVEKSWKFLEKEDNWEAPTPESERWVRNCALLKFVSPPPPKWLSDKEQLENPVVLTLMSLSLVLNKTLYLYWWHAFYDMLF